MKWMIVGPSVIYEHHRAQVVKELQRIKREDESLAKFNGGESGTIEIVTWDYCGANLVIAEEAKRLGFPVKMFKGTEPREMNYLALPNNHLSLRANNAMQDAIDYCDYGVVFLNVGSMTAMEALFRLYIAHNEKKMRGTKLYRFVSIDSRPELVGGELEEQIGKMQEDLEDEKEDKEDPDQ